VDLPADSSPISPLNNACRLFFQLGRRRTPLAADRPPTAVRAVVASPLPATSASVVLDRAAIAALTRQGGRRAAALSLHGARPAPTRTDPSLRPPTPGRRRGRSTAAAVAALSIVALLALAVGIARLQGAIGPGSREQPLLAYCAAGLKGAVEPAAKEFERQYGTPVRLQYGPSGALETQMRLAQKGDLSIPAAADPFLAQGRARGTVREIVPLAQFRLVLGVNPRAAVDIGRFADIRPAGLAYGLPNADAAIGQAAQQALNAAGAWHAARRGARVFLPTVTELAEAVRQGDLIQAAPLWDATARQYGLASVDLPEFADRTAEISAGVLAFSRRPSVALKFARFLASPEKGQIFFSRAHYQCRPGDPWAEVPELTLFGEPALHGALAPTLAEFAQREGCRIDAAFEEPAALADRLRAGKPPDVFLARDVAAFETFRECLGEVRPLAANRLVLAARRGNPSGLRTLGDLARPGLRVGLGDPESTAWGRRTRDLLRTVGAWEAVAANRPRPAVTAESLVAQLAAGDGLDAVIVEEDACATARDQLALVPIDHPRALATPLLAINRQARRPQLSQRLEAALAEPRARRRWESADLLGPAEMREDPVGPKAVSPARGGAER
jgi:molybdate transport system substrate-binding protein